MLSSVGAVVLAAGEARRMGCAKQALPFGSSTLLGHALDAARGAGCAAVVAVTGAHRAQVVALLPAGVREAHNPAWAQGMGGSIATGVRALLDTSSPPQAILVLLADQPHVTAATLTALRAAATDAAGRYAAGRYDAVALAYPHGPGVPALFLAPAFPALLGLREQVGARRLLGGGALRVLTLDLPGVHADIDTPQDYAALTASTSPASTLTPCRS